MATFHDLLSEEDLDNFGNDNEGDDNIDESSSGNEEMVFKVSFAPFSTNAILSFPIIFFIKDS